MSTHLKRLTYMAIMAVIICICSWITVPFTVPFTMQTFAVFCSLLLLGGKEGTASIGIYLFMGLVGLPVFSGFQGGIGRLFGPTGGYIIGFLLSGIIYMFFEPAIKKKRGYRWAALITGLVICYFVGTMWFVSVYNSRGTAYNVLSALGLCVLPYIIPDLLKMVLAVYICDRVRKALPAIDQRNHA